MKNLVSRSWKVMVLGALLCTVVVASAWAADVAQMTTPSAMARATKKVTPTYPPAARQLNIQGQQELTVLVNESGDVEDAKVSKGNALFTVSSMAAIKQWKFTPMVKDGAPVKFETVIVFNYAK
jgi:TonB family protein